MKSATLVVLSVPAALAAPAILQNEKRQAKGSNVCFVWARGSIEPSPLGLQPGPQLQAALRIKFPGMKTFPVAYAASITTNISTARTDPASIATAVKTFKQAANSGCTSIVAGGYSQGAAVMHNSVQSLDQSIKDKIAGVALFGDTRNQQDKGHIKNFPPEKSKVWCNASDGVCSGTLLVGVTHLAYAGDAGAAANWLAGRVAVHNGGSESSSGSAASGLLAKLSEARAGKDSGKSSAKESKGSKESSSKGSGIDLSAILSKLGSGKESGSKDSGSKESKGSGIDLSAIIAKLGAGKESASKESGSKESKGSGIDLSAIIAKLGAGKESGSKESGSKGSGIDLSAIIAKLGSGKDSGSKDSGSKDSGKSSKSSKSSKGESKSAKASKGGEAKSAKSSKGKSSKEETTEEE